MFYAGDGVSDLSAAKETDLLFAKKGHGKSSRPKLKMHVVDAGQILSTTVCEKTFHSRSLKIGLRF